MDAAERALLAATVHEALAARDRPASVDGILADLGWRDMLDAEPDDAVDIVFTALGANNAGAAAIEDVVAHGLGAKPRDDVTVLLPPFGTWDAPAHIDGDAMHAVGLATARAATADEMLIVCNANGDGNLRAVTMPAAAAQITAVHGIDPDAGFHVVRVDAPAALGATVDGATWLATIALTRRAVAHQLAGASRAMLELGRTHALERVQFGRPIARFQAVRHRLAEALVAIEALESALAAARDAPGNETAALAKALAGRAARIVATHCQQVLAGIGFTTEHPFHRYLKRTMVLDGIFGTADDIAVALGRTLLAERTVPNLVEL